MTDPKLKQVETLVRIYRNGASDLAGLLGSTDFQRGKASRLLAQVDAIAKKLAVESVRIVDDATRENYQAGLASGDRKLREVGVDIVPAQKMGVEWNRINEGAIETFARQISADLSRASGELADKGKRIIRGTSQMVLADHQISETIAKGLVSGGSKDNIARALRARLAEGGRELLDSGKMTPAQLKQIVDFDAGVIQAGKVQLRIVDYTRMVASFQLRQAVVSAEKDRLVQQGEEMGDAMMFDLVIITGAISGDACDFYVNKAFSISGKSSEYPPLSSVPGGGPPFHPYCTHTIAPFVREFVTAKQMQRAKIEPHLLNIDLNQAAKLYKGADNVFAARRQMAPPNSRSSRPQE